ncbi:MAG: UDP-N-acetylglucosamine 2-epimerase (non-hydrolyzing) [Bdellovibrionales bacterium]|nr:UDP-N-acetylglucosamine 2-epimerase (non-hydrolyzing) [Ramlibacter sp.]
MKLLIAFGTRPEVIKLAPVIAQAQRRADDVQLVVCSTGQHREMLEQAMQVFGVRPDVELAVMRPDQTLPALTARLIEGMSDAITTHKPDAVIVQGDTTSAFAAALAAFYQQVPVAHVEAGLRTGDLASPFPEELNRVLVGRMARWHFPPTPAAAANLLREGVAPGAITVTGNTVVDAIGMVRTRWAGGTPAAMADPFPGKDLVLVTAHRRENHGPALLQICAALRELCGLHPELGFVFPVHLNPRVREVVLAELGGIANLQLTAPVDFEGSLWLQSRSCLVITDSGGIQEEAPSFGLPAVVMREHTERSEGIDAGFATLAGTITQAIVQAAQAWLLMPNLRTALARKANPYGDGMASQRIVATLLGEPVEGFHG